MKVVNVKFEECDVYVGRGKGSSLGNPIKFGEKCIVCKQVHGYDERDELVDCYRKWLWWKIKDDEDYKENVRRLDGKVLGCWCAPKRCHADVLLRAAQWLSKE
jgi:hypothetical protein